MVLMHNSFDVYVLVLSALRIKFLFWVVTVLTYVVNHPFKGTHYLQLQLYKWKHFVLSRRCPSYQTMH